MARQARENFSDFHDDIMLYSKFAVWGQIVTIFEIIDNFMTYRLDELWLDKCALSAQKCWNFNYINKKFSFQRKLAEKYKIMINN